MESNVTTVCTAAGVAEVRSLLADDRPAQRSAAIDLVSAWRCLDDDPATPSAILAASVALPRPVQAAQDVAVSLVELLWMAPELVPVEEIEAAYLLASEPVRRALLDLLARRRAPDAVTVLAHVIADRGWNELLPFPAPGLLAAALGHPRVGALVPVLVSLSIRSGWEAHAAWLLRQLVEEADLGIDDTAELLDALDPIVAVLVERCDVAASGPEPSWRDRHRVRSLVGVLEGVRHHRANDVLGRVQASADPVLNAWAVAALASRGAVVPWDRVWMAAHDPVSRSVLMDGLERRGVLERVFDDAGLLRTGVGRAEADLVAWLARPGELGCEPDEIEHVASRSVRIGDDADPSAPAGDAAVHLFRFRTRAPHWACARGWMVGAAGLYHDDATVPHGTIRVAMSLFDCEDERSVSEHFDSIAAALGAG